MKKMILIFIPLVFYCCCSSNNLIINDDFLSDLSSENSRIAANLYLSDFNGNLEKLTYDYFIEYLGKHEAHSAIGITKKIQKADEYFFKPNKDAFLLLLYYKNESKIIGDNSSTTFIDTLIVLKQMEPKPELNEVAKKMKF